MTHRSRLTAVLVDVPKAEHERAVTFWSAALGRDGKTYDKFPEYVVFGEATPFRGNHVRIRLSPQVAIAIGARSKRPGEGMAGQPVELSVVEEPAEACLGDYERLLGDAMSGDATLFARQDVVEAAWAIVDPLLADPGPMSEYEPGSWGPPQADRLVAEIGGWNTPQ